MQNRLGVIVRLVAYCHNLSTNTQRHTLKENVSLTPPDLFHTAGFGLHQPANIARLDGARQRKVVSGPLHERRIFFRFAAAKVVVEVRDVKFQLPTTLRVETEQQVEQGHRISP
ncbi:MAG: hypothetical protein O7H40_11710, partial [Gammaproteobacteria bacterium]|nr:hypothetical protein [Gammaproteobacteria bacterium]